MCVEGGERESGGWVFGEVLHLGWSWGGPARPVGATGRAGPIGQPHAAGGIPYAVSRSG